MAWSFAFCAPGVQCGRACEGGVECSAWFPRWALVAAAFISAAMSDYSTGGPPPPSAGPPGAGGGTGAAGPPNQAGGGSAVGTGQAGGAAGPGPGGIRKDAFADAVQRARQVRSWSGAPIVGGGEEEEGSWGQRSTASLPGCAGKGLVLRGSWRSAALRAVGWGSRLLWGDKSSGRCHLTRRGEGGKWPKAKSVGWGVSFFLREGYFKGSGNPAHVGQFWLSNQARK